MSDARPPVGIVGAGTMGSGIAQVAATAGREVLLYDVDDEPLQTGLDRLAGYLRRAAEKGRLGPAEAEAAIDRVAGKTSLDALRPAGLIVEAAPEILSLKRKIFAELEEIAPADTMFATNTSTLSVSAIAGALRSPSRLGGMHFFNPAPLMPLVEVIRGFETAPAVTASLMETARAWGKVPILVADTPGFIVNRVARPFYGEALRLLGDGIASARTVDRLVRDAGFPMGPFELMDLIGIDVNLAAAESVFDGFFGDPRFRPHPIQRTMVASGRLGRKSGRGYYEYGKDEA